MRRTFLDANVLIWAARGNHSLSNAAMKYLDDPNREFIASDMLRLEVLPKAVYNGNRDEAEFYRVYFDAVHTMVPVDKQLTAAAEIVAVKHGLSAVDALHVAAAIQSGAVEFITGEKSTKPMFRVTSIHMKSIRPTN